MGGALAAIESGYMQSEIQEAAYQYQQSVEIQEQIVVGVNQYQVEEQLDLDQLKVDPAIAAGQSDRLAVIRERRDPQRATELLNQLVQTANSKENLMPLLIDCVENDLTLGEICGALRNVWGEYQESTWI
jgi:methylmalonyl-CoA mutase N-terminal domain/subunit